MKTTVRFFEVFSAGHGHNKVTAILNDGRSFSLTTSATYYTDYINDEDEPEKQKKAILAITEMIQQANDLDDNWESIHE